MPTQISVDRSIDDGSINSIDPHHTCSAASFLRMSVSGVRFAHSATATRSRSIFPSSSAAPFLACVRSAQLSFLLLSLEGWRARARPPRSIDRFLWIDRVCVVAAGWAGPLLLGGAVSLNPSRAPQAPIIITASSSRKRARTIPLLSSSLAAPPPHLSHPPRRT